MNPSLETNDTRRSNLAALRWDAAWIDPALRRMADAAAQRAGLSVEAWLERAIRKSCGMPAAHQPAQRVEEPPAPTQFFSAVLGEAKRELPRQPVEPHFRQSAEPPKRPPARDAIQTRQPKATATDDEPLALTQPIDYPPPRPMRRPAAAIPPQETRGTSLFLAVGVAAALAVVAVMVVRDPNLVRDRFLAASNETNSGPAAVSNIASHDSAPLRVLPRTSERTATIAVLPPPVELNSDAAVHESAAPVEASVAVPTVAAAPASVPVSTSAPAALPPVAVALAPTAPAAPMTTQAPPPAAAPRPVQMAALPTQGGAAAAVATDAPPPAMAPQATVNEPSEAAPTIDATLTTPKPQAAKAVPSQAPVVKPAPAAPPSSAASAPPSSVATGVSTQVAMAPTATPLAPTTTMKQDGDGTAIAADAKMAAELEGKAKTGDHVAEYRLGILYALGKGVPRDYDSAAKLLHRSAESGLAEAQYDYGVLSDKGLGLPRDAAEAARWYAKAAAQGHPPAALNLGYAYAEGLGVVRNLPEAARWFRRAAEAGLINAQFNLAYMFEEGAGLNKSAVDAYAWYSVAAERGDEGAQQAATRIAAKMSPRELQLAKSRIKTVKRSIRVQN